MNRARTVLLAALACAQVILAPVWAASDDVEQRIHRIEAGLSPLVLVKGEVPTAPSLAARMEALRVPGVSVAVIHDGKIEWARGFGVTRTGGPPVSADTLFQAASISKPVSALAAMRLVETGKLNLDADINDYLKSWKLPANDFTRQAKVTLRGLLTHSAGVTVHGFRGYDAGTPLPTTAQVLNGEAPANSPAIRVDILPGSLWRYSGGGYVIAQQAMVDVTGTAFPQLLQKLVLQPFGMKHSTYEQPLPEKRLAEVATPYRGDGSPVKGGPHVYPELGAAGLWTTPSDLAALAVGVSRVLSGKSKGAVSEATLHAMLAPALNQQAIGFQVGGRTERKWLSHGGSNDGYRCFLIAYQDGRDGAVIMTNSDSGDRLVGDLTRTIAHVYGWPDYAPAERVLSAVDPASFDRYVGAYQFDNGVVFTFWREGAQIRSRIQGQAATDLFPTSEKEYFAKIVDARITFADEAGGSASAVLHQNDRDQTVKRMDSPQGRAELDWSLGIETRFKEQMPAPGSEAALRHLIDGLASGNPAYDEMGPALAQATRTQLPTLRPAVTAFGALQAISFKRVQPSGWDVYEVKFERATRDFSLALQADGRTYGALFSP